MADEKQQEHPRIMSLVVCHGMIYGLDGAGEMWIYDNISEMAPRWIHSLAEEAYKVFLISTLAQDIHRRGGV